MKNSPDTRWRWLLLGGAVCVAATAGAARALELGRLGRTDASALQAARVEVQERFDRMSRTLEAIGESLAGRPALVPAVSGGAGRLRELFTLVGSVLPAAEPAEFGITIYGESGTALAWSGRPSEVGLPRLGAEAPLFVTPGPLGLRLVHVRPIVDGERGGGRRVGSIVVERVVSGTRAWRPVDEAFVLETSVAPVWLRPAAAGAGDEGDGHFVVRTPGGEPLLEASIDAAEVSRTRARLRSRGLAVLLAVVAATLLLVGGPLLDARARARTAAGYGAAALALAAGLLAVRGLLYAAVGLWTRSGAVPPDPMGAGATTAAVTWGLLGRSPLDLLFSALAFVGLVLLSADLVWRMRHRGRRRRQPPAENRPRVEADAPEPWRKRSRRAPASDALTFAGFVASQLVAGLGLAAVLVVHAALVERAMMAAGPESIQLSLHPAEPSRLATVFGLLWFQVGLLWTGTLALVAALGRWRFSWGSPRLAIATVAAWLMPTVAVVLLAGRWGRPVPLGAALLAAAACVLVAARARRLVAWSRHAPQASRLLGLALALVLPPLLLYPTVVHFADLATRRLVETQYGPQAAHHAEEMQARLDRSLDQIDAIPGLDLLVTTPEPATGAPPQTETAFLVWRTTDLATYRLTSAVEIYDAEGQLASRFALNFPDYGPAQGWSGNGCTWDVFGEVLPFGAQDRQTLHAERAVCIADGEATGLARVGAIVVHVGLDFRTLPFISSQSPYFELFRVGQLPLEGAPHGPDIELAVYGWGLSPMFVSGTSAWSIDQATFDRIYAARDPFWTTLPRGEGRDHVYLLNDRSGIYALGFPALGPFDHLVRLAEISTVAGAAFLGLLALTALFSRVARTGPWRGRTLLREIRASFYRRLFIAFVAASVVPALALAFVIRTYFAAELRSDVETGATRTARVAQRVVEETAALLQRADERGRPISDDVLVWISQFIDQEINVFDGAELAATSERDLFASGLLPTRTPEEVYRAIALQRMPTFVGEDWIGDFRYLLAAAPLGAGGRDAILTVPLLPRQQEIEREIDDLDRGIQLGALLFVLLGAAIGYSMAERIADPVNRLTRATRRIARGDFDARVAARSADELQRLVDAFNRMGAELKEQRVRLERTHRLEAWAEMARQVAHEIKNPLTPIQLSAEHLERVHADQGRPMSPVLEGCVQSILSQVRLLRGIAAEFSSFASSPTARPSPTVMADLVEEVIDPYRVGLHDRIALEIDVPRVLPVLPLDRVLIARALANIVENALHAMPGRGALRVVGRRVDGRVRLTVADTGSGMDEESLARVFEPYFSTRTGGTGLGLTIAKRNVELSGGAIEVQSRKGEGTAVTLTFPVA